MIASLALEEKLSVSDAPPSLITMIFGENESGVMEKLFSSFFSDVLQLLLIDPVSLVIVLVTFSCSVSPSLPSQKNSQKTSLLKYFLLSGQSTVNG